MILTVDPSVILSVVLNEPTKPALVKLTEGAELLSPPSLPWEVGNALSALVRRDRITALQAQEALTSFQRIPVRLAEIQLEKALEMATSHRIFAYDAFVLECARRYRTPLLSLDQRQLAVALIEEIEVLPIEP